MNKLNIVTNKIKQEIPLNGGMILISSVNRQWLTNLQTSLGYLIINAKGEKIFITDTRYFLIASIELKDDTTVWCMSNKPDASLSNLIKKAIEQLKIQTLLFEEEYISINEYELLKDIPNKKFSSKELRIIKDDNEIESLQKAADIAVDTVNWVFSWIKPGYSEKEIAKKIAIKFLELGASENSFSTIVAAAQNGSIPHHRPTDYIIQDGDFVTIDCGCMYNDFASDMTRTFVVGKQANNSEMVEIYNTVYEAQQRGLAAAIAGNTTLQVDAVCRDYIDSTKYKGLFGHGTGHGVGLEVHELPVVSTKYERLLVKNHVLTVEPGIYKSGVGGVRIEDTVVIKNDKLLILTDKCTKKLQYINNN